MSNNIHCINAKNIHLVEFLLKNSISGMKAGNRGRGTKLLNSLEGLVYRIPSPNHPVKQDVTVFFWGGDITVDSGG